MNRIAPVLALLILSSACASQTVIRSNPSGASVKNQYGQVLGKTPYVHEDTEVWNHREHFTLELEGYKPTQLSIKRDDANAGRMIGFGLGGFFFPPIWAGLLWAADYNPAYRIELEPASGDVATATTDDYVRAY